MRRALCDDEIGGVGGKDIAVAGRAVDPRVMISMFGINEEVVAMVLGEEKPVAIGGPIVHPWNGSVGSDSRCHGTIPYGRKRADFANDA